MFEKPHQILIDNRKEITRIYSKKKSLIITD